MYENSVNVSWVEKKLFSNHSIREKGSETHLWLRPGGCPDLGVGVPVRLDLSAGCWDAWLKRTLFSWGGLLSSFCADSSSYCFFMAAGTTWKRITWERIACLKMFCALKVKQHRARERAVRSRRQKWISFKHDKRYMYNDVAPKLGRYRRIRKAMMCCMLKGDTESWGLRG